MKRKGPTLHDMVRKTASKTGHYIDATEHVVKAFIDVLVDEIERNQVVRINHIGTFIHRIWQSGIRNHAQTGDQVFLGSRKVLRFKACASWKRKLNQKGKDQ